MTGLVAAESWASLEHGLGGEGVARRRVAPTAPVDIFVAVEHPGLVWLVTFGVANIDLLPRVEVPSAIGIAVRAVPSPGADGWGHVEVRLADKRFQDLYIALIDDLANYVAAASDGVAAAERFGERLSCWESFLRVQEQGGLSSERRAGLYGELYCAREHLLPLLGEATVGLWAGPAPAHQDFQADGWAIEVKTSRVKTPISVRIASERQLDDLGLRFLGLAHVGLEQRQNSGETLPEIIASIRARLTGLRRDLFDNKLIEAGYVDAQRDLYADDGYVVRFDEIFRVVDGFPRLTERDLMDGVGDIAYSVSVPALAAFRVDWTDLPTLIEAQPNDGSH